MCSLYRADICECPECVVGWTSTGNLCSYWEKWGQLARVGATTRWVGIIKNKRKRIAKSTMGNPQWQSKLFSKVSWMWPMLRCLLACFPGLLPAWLWPATKVCTLIKFVEMAAWRVARDERVVRTVANYLNLCANCTLIAPALTRPGGQLRGTWHVANWRQSLKLLQFL